MMERTNTITMRGNEVSITVGVLLFKDDGCYIAYCPPLDLSGYDTTEESAQASLEYTLRDWLKEQMANGTLHDDLVRHGWSFSSSFSSIC